MFVQIVFISVCIVSTAMHVNGRTRRDELRGLEMKWSIKDLRYHHLSWNDVYNEYSVYSAWKDMGSSGSSRKFVWDEVAVKRPTKLQHVGNISKCTLNIPFRMSSKYDPVSKQRRHIWKLTLRLCRVNNKNKCRAFRIEGDDFVEPKYYTSLSSMNITRHDTWSKSAQLYISFPTALCEYDDVKYSIGVRRYNEKTGTCDISGLLTDKQKVASKYQICDGLVANVTNGLRANMKQCILLQYETIYRGKQIPSDIFTKTITTEVDMNEDINDELLRFGFIFVSLLLVLATVGVGKFFVEPKWRKYEIKMQSKNNKIFEDISLIIGDETRTVFTFTPVEKAETVHKLESKDERNKEVNEDNDEEMSDNDDRKSISSSGSIPSTIPYPSDVTPPSSDQVPGYVGLANKQAENQLIIENDGYSGKPDADV